MSSKTPPAPAAIGSVPTEANSKGGLNESTPIAQRSPEGAPLADGPVRGENDSFLPASYTTSRGNIRSDR